MNKHRKWILSSIFFASFCTLIISRCNTLRPFAKDETYAYIGLLRPYADSGYKTAIAITKLSQNRPRSTTAFEGIQGQELLEYQRAEEFLMEVFPQLRNRLLKINESTAKKYYFSIIEKVTRAKGLNYQDFLFLDGGDPNDPLVSTRFFLILFTNVGDDRVELDIKYELDTTYYPFYKDSKAFLPDIGKISNAQRETIRNKFNPTISLDDLKNLEYENNYFTAYLTAMFGSAAIVRKYYAYEEYTPNANDEQHYCAFVKEQKCSFFFKWLKETQFFVLTGDTLLTLSRQMQEKFDSFNPKLPLPNFYSIENSHFYMHEHLPLFFHEKANFLVLEQLAAKGTPAEVKTFLANKSFVPDELYHVMGIAYRASKMENVLIFAKHRGINDFSQIVQCTQKVNKPLYGCHTPFGSKYEYCGRQGSYDIIEKINIPFVQCLNEGGLAFEPLKK